MISWQLPTLKEFVVQVIALSTITLAVLMAWVVLAPYDPISFAR